MSELLAFVLRDTYWSVCFLYNARLDMWHMIGWTLDLCVVL